MTPLMRIPRVLRHRALERVLIVFVIVSIFEVAQVLRCLASATNEPVAQRSERVYIASIHWNSERILRSHWNDAVIALADALGQENVFVAVYESGSWDDSKGALRELDTALAAHNIRRNITLSDTTHLDDISVPNRRSGWVDTPRGKKELRRIPYLSRLRNWTLEPLQELAQRGERFDKVLFLNDVVFTVCLMNWAALDMPQ
jgi:hypothetical protein